MKRSLTARRGEDNQTLEMLRRSKNSVDQTIGHCLTESTMATGPGDQTQIIQIPKSIVQWISAPDVVTLLSVSV